jgi:hypothetical protein
VLNEAIKNNTNAKDASASASTVTVPQPTRSCACLDGAAVDWVHGCATQCDDDPPAATRIPARRRRRRQRRAPPIDGAGIGTPTVPHGDRGAMCFAWSMVAE